MEPTRDIEDSELVAQPDRLRPMTSFFDDEQTCVSEITHSSVFVGGGPLYPSRSIALMSAVSAPNVAANLMALSEPSSEGEEATESSLERDATADDINAMNLPCKKEDSPRVAVGVVAGHGDNQSKETTTHGISKMQVKEEMAKALKFLGGDEVPSKDGIEAADEVDIEAATFVRDIQSRMKANCLPNNGGLTRKHVQSDMLLAHYQEIGAPVQQLTSKQLRNDILQTSSAFVEEPSQDSASADSEEQRTPHSTEELSRPGAFRVAPVGQGMPADLEQGQQSSADDTHTDTVVPTPGNLTVAHPVEDIPLPQAEEFSDKPKKSTLHKNFWCILAPVAAALVILAIVVAIALLAQKDQNQEPALADNLSIQTMAPTSPGETLVLSLLPNSTVKDIVESVNSSQAFAFEWIIKDPNLFTYPDWRIRQRFALATFFHATGGTEGLWKHSEGWLSHDQHECYWSAITLKPLLHANPGAEVANVPQFEANMNISKPSTSPKSGSGNGPPKGPSKAKPKDFTPCGLGFNAPFANLNPETEGQYLQLLQVNNGLSGNIPKEIFLLTSLLTLDLTTNHLSGSMPTEVGQLTALNNIHMAFNHMSGALPSTIFLPNLKQLEAHVNDFSGTIPTEVGLATSLRIFGLDENHLTGSLPSEFGLLGENLRVLAARRSLLTSSLPSDLGQLSSLIVTDVRHNQLSSTIPSELGKMDSLRTLGLEGNMNLIGSVPTELALLPKLEILDINLTSITGAIPEQLCGKEKESGEKERGLLIRANCNMVQCCQ